MRNIAIITENFYKPWSPNDLEEFLGGSQECVVLLAEALIRYGYKLTVFTIGPVETKEQYRNSIRYCDYKNFSLDDNFSSIILFKINPLPDDERLQNINVIYWSSDVEERPDSKYITKYVCLTEYHKKRCGWDDAVVIPHGMDTISLTRNKMPRVNNTMLYCSSLDRGFNSLLDEWINIKKNNKNIQLYVTYGFKIAKQISSSVGEMLADKREESVKFVCDILDIKYLGHVSKTELEQLYWQCQYWCLPLNNPDSELFCFNAVKSQFCGCIPVVNKVGALTETVGKYIDFHDFCAGNYTIRDVEQPILTLTWDQVVTRYWTDILV